MNELTESLAAMGLTWAGVWRLTVDRRTGEVIVIAADGRKLAGRLGRERATARRVRNIKHVA